MAVDLLLISLFHTEDDLRRHDSFIRIHEPEVRIYAERGGVLEEMSGDRFVVHCVLHVVARLVHSQQCKTVEDARVDSFTAVRNNADNNLGAG